MYEIFKIIEEVQTELACPWALFNFHGRNAFIMLIDVAEDGKLKKLKVAV